MEGVAIRTNLSAYGGGRFALLAVQEEATEPLMDEILARLWHNITARLTGPMNLRLILQPTVATIFAVRAGLRDAHQNRPAFLWAVLRNPAHRRELLRQGWKDVGKVFFVAVILDVVYQLIVHRGAYLLELLITAVTLAIVPYFLLRGQSAAS